MGGDRKGESISSKFDIAGEGSELKNLRRDHGRSGTSKLMKKSKSSGFLQTGYNNDLYHDTSQGDGDDYQGEYGSYDLNSPPSSSGRHRDEEGHKKRRSSSKKRSSSSRSKSDVLPPHRAAAVAAAVLVSPTREETREERKERRRRERESRHSQGEAVDAAPAVAVVPADKADALKLLCKKYTSRRSKSLEKDGALVDDDEDKKADRGGKSDKEREGRSRSRRSKSNDKYDALVSDDDVDVDAEENVTKSSSGRRKHRSSSGHRLRSSRREKEQREREQREKEREKDNHDSADVAAADGSGEFKSPRRHSRRSSKKDLSAAVAAYAEEVDAELKSPSGGKVKSRSSVRRRSSKKDPKDVDDDDLAANAAAATAAVDAAVAHEDSMLSPSGSSRKPRRRSSKRDLSSNENSDAADMLSALLSPRNAAALQNQKSKKDRRDKKHKDGSKLSASYSALQVPSDDDDEFANVFSSPKSNERKKIQENSTKEKKQNSPPPAPPTVKEVQDMASKLAQLLKKSTVEYQESDDVSLAFSTFKPIESHAVPTNKKAVGGNGRSSLSSHLDLANTSAALLFNQSFNNLETRTVSSDQSEMKTEKMKKKMMRSKKKNKGGEVSLKEEQQASKMAAELSEFLNSSTANFQDTDDISLFSSFKPISMSPQPIPKKRSSSKPAASSPAHRTSLTDHLAFQSPVLAHLMKDDDKSVMSKQLQPQKPKEAMKQEKQASKMADQLAALQAETINFEDGDDISVFTKGTTVQWQSMWAHC